MKVTRKNQQNKVSAHCQSLQPHFNTNALHALRTTFRPFQNFKNGLVLFMHGSLRCRYLTTRERRLRECRDELTEQLDVDAKLRVKEDEIRRLELEKSKLENLRQNEPHSPGRCLFLLSRGLIIIYYAIRQPKRTVYDTFDNKSRQNTHGNGSKLI